PRDADEDPMVVEARRQVIEHCLYGVDINPMAVEMAKLSLWLVSMDPQRPFTFLDDRLVAGDSLLGVTSLEQIEYLCLDPNQAREWREGTLPWSADVRSAVAEATAARRRLTDVELGDDPIAALEHKRLLLGEAEAATGRLRLFADLAVGAALAGSKKMAGSRDPRVREEQGEERRVSREGLYLEAVDLAGKVAAGEEFAAREKARRWLETDTPADAKAAGILRTPLHWPLVFPEVFDSGGFDAVIGNPPFLGGLKLQTALGGSYRDYLVGYLGRDVRGNRGTGDLVAYFALRVHQLLTPSGQAGLLATNTLAQGDSRRVGLDQILADGARIRRAIKSAPWPSRSASLEYCAVWFSEQAPSQGMMALLDGVETTEISASLEPASRASGNPYRLMANANMAFQGANILGLGFTLSEQVAREWIAEDPRYRDVLFPYLSGDDVNSSPDASASRWVINFHDWSEDRARTYPHCYEQVRALVKPERDIVTYSKAASQRWWQFLLNRPALRKASAGLGSMIALTQVSNTVIPLMIDKDNVCSHKVVVFASDDRALLVFLSSSIHYWWTVRWTSTMGAGSAISYSPVDVFQTLARPDHVNPLRHLGDRLDTYRRSVMLARQTGLTKTYNLVFDPTVHDEDIVELRRIHKAIDEATVRAYGWDDLLDKLDHGFHPAGRDLRYTIGPWAQREILDRLLELNHERYAEEVAKGLHDKKKPRAAASKTAAKKKPADPEGLF
ncbi:MAG: SAM-dependent DNA methyltransferase, partial [Pseudonocardia sp.]